MSFVNDLHMWVKARESKRSWKSRWAEHKPGTRRMTESSIKEHAETTGHDVHSDDVHILEKGVMNYHKRLFLESFHSCNDNMTPGMSI